jgi:hypothetical protein
LEWTPPLQSSTRVAKDVYTQSFLTNSWRSAYIRHHSPNVHMERSKAEKTERSKMEENSITGGR